ncbi:hypothetical protein HPP92_019161 [Vanilla planifolia]|uniref:Uncharacterized protein n=1 Tax=Vanilla planifolia TaxID=51239 RepID=A0A835QBY9_VANPL|nr:hypothetical protein HPP92_019161 [Vanilla planifolia]
MGPSLESVDEVVEEIMRIHRSLPARPSMDELEAATTLLRHVDGEEQTELDAISKRKKGFQIPDELFFILQEMQKNLVYFQCKEQKREALQLLDLENIHVLFDEMIQNASTCFQSPSNKGSLPTTSVPSYSMHSEKGSTCHSKANLSSFVAVNRSGKEAARKTELVTRDDTYVKRAKPTMALDGPSLTLTVPQGLFMNSTPVSKPKAFSEADGGKLSLIKLARLIEVTAKEGTPDLILTNKLGTKLNGFQILLANC